MQSMERTPRIGSTLELSTMLQIGTGVWTTRR